MKRILTDHDAIETSLATRGAAAELDQIFEPIRFETLSDLFVQYERDRDRMEHIASIFDGSNAELIRHFVAANVDSSSYLNPDRLFELAPALSALDADYWQRALKLTDIYEAMPQQRRDEWINLIHERKAPTFDRVTVMSTLQDLLAQRHKFFAERVDGIFRSLSRSHVTNRPEGFSKRMIISYVMSFSIVEPSRCGTINDLRCVIARFMGREEPRYQHTSSAIEFAARERCGQWTVLDGGALRLRVYKNRNAHLEVHPEMAWRLNAVLASIYPNAIPEEHRRRPKKRAPKDFQFFSRPLPFPVLTLLLDGYMQGRIFQFRYGANKKNAYAEACDVLRSLGAVESGTDFAFDFPAQEVIRQVCASGMMPDQRAHQYYPTPPSLAARVVEAAAIEPHHTVLEPSAGQGGIAHLLPPEQTTLVEVADLYAEVLRAKKLGDVIQTDFLRWMPGRRFDRIVMNPPFTGTQWQRHLEHASELLAADGRIVAVLPAGARNSKILPGWSCTWSDPEPFPGTSIEVVVLVARRPE